MSRKASHGSERDAAAQFDGGKNLFHAGDGGARQSFAVERHIETAFIGSTDLDGSGILARATKQKIAEAVAFADVATGAAKEESAGAIAKEAAEFAIDASG